MNIKYPISSVAERLAEPARAGMLEALLDGQALPAGEPAMIAGVSAHRRARTFPSWLLEDCFKYRAKCGTAITASQARK